MSAPIGPGDWVECVKCSPHGHMRGLRLGGVYRVCEIIHGPRSCDGCGTNHEGLALDGLFANPGWAICAFRPIYRPRADLIQRLLSPVPGVRESVTE